MKIDHQVISLELAITLQGLGLKQKVSYYSYKKYTSHFVEHLVLTSFTRRCESFDAYLLSELGVMVGVGTKTAERFYGYMNAMNIGMMFRPDVVARFLLLELEGGHVTAEELNERLKSA